MDKVLSLLIVALVAIDVLSLDLSLAPGLSLKNAMLYFVASMLLLRTLGSEGLRIELRALHVAFALMIGYALLSWLIAALVIGYPRYGLLQAAIPLKADLIDHFVFFLVFFYGLRTAAQSQRAARVVLGAIIVANIAVILDVAGVMQLGAANIDDGRVEGVIGEANQQAALDAMLLPLAVATALHTRGIARLGWLAGALILFAAIVMTVSRGAFVALFVALVWTAWLFRRSLSFGRIAGWTVLTAVCAMLTLLAVGSQFTALVEERVIAQSLSTDTFDATSGRSYIWSNALERMFESPLSLITGFGWAVYDSMQFRFAPHNHYLGLWFNIGVVGVACFLFILGNVIATARRAAEHARGAARATLIAFVCGLLAIAVAIFFVELHRPWLYVWAYVGCAMRLAVLARAEAHEHLPAAPHPAPSGADLYGWTAGSRR